MKRILILIIGLIGVAYGQSSPTSSKTRFVNGLYVGTKLDSYFAAADSNAIYWRADSVVMAKYKGTARALAFAVSGGYLPISDTSAMLTPYPRWEGSATQIPFGRGTRFLNGSNNFVWDNTNTRLGIGTNAPARVVDIVENANVQSYIYHQNNSSGTGAESKYGASNGTDLIDFGMTGTNFTTSGIWWARRGIIHGNSPYGLGIGTNNGPIDFSASNNINVVSMRLNTGRLAVGDTFNVHYRGVFNSGNASAEFRDIAIGGTTGGWNNGERHTISGVYGTINADDIVGSVIVGFDATNKAYIGLGNLYTTSNQSVDKFRFFSSGNAAIGFDDATDDFTHVLRVNGLAKATGFATGGTSAQFLKADGSVDINAYIPTNGFNGVTGNINSIAANGFSVTGQSGVTAYYRVNQTANSGPNWRIGHTGGVAGFNTFDVLNETAGTVPISINGTTDAITLNSSISTKKIIGNSSTPSISGGSATYIGTGATTSVSGNDIAGVALLNTGTGCSSTGASNRSAFSVTFSSAYSAAPIVQIQAIQQGGLSSTDGPTNNFFLRRDAVGTGSFIVYLPIGVTLTDSTTYLITYQVIGR